MVDIVGCPCVKVGDAMFCWWEFTIAWCLWLHFSFAL